MEVLTELEKEFEIFFEESEVILDMVDHLEELICYISEKWMYAAWWENHLETILIRSGFRGKIMLSTKVKKIVQHAYQTVPFYMNAASKKNINLNEWLELP